MERVYKRTCPSCKGCKKVREGLEYIDTKTFVSISSEQTMAADLLAAFAPKGKVRLFHEYGICEVTSKGGNAKRGRELLKALAAEPRLDECDSDDEDYC